MLPDPDKFHAHLDICKQCREHPFNLCAEGSRVLFEAATGLPSNTSPTGRVPRDSPFQDLPLNTELGRQIREAFGGPPGSAFVATNYSAVEMRGAATLVPLVCAECGHEENLSMSTPCVSCGSVRVVLRSVIEATFGPDWREAFKGPKP